MQLPQFIFIVVIIIAKKCSAGLSVKTSMLDESLVEASIEVLESCYADRFSTVGIAGPFAGSITKRMSLRETVIPTTLIDETSRRGSYDPDDLDPYMLQVFVITVTDLDILVNTLTQVKNSIWWNHMASFFLIDSTRANNGCSNAYEMLWEAWKINLLNTNFMCLHQTRQRLIYTFNPYTSEAPGPWQQEKTYKGINDHVWTLFVREYRADESRCHGLDFDKTVDLGGYETRVYGAGRIIRGADSNGRASVVLRMENVTGQLLMDSLNATWKLSPSSLGSSHVDLEEIRKGISDISIIINAPSFSGQYESTCPIIVSEISVMTEYQGYKSQLGKLISVLDESSRFGVVAVLMITLFFFKYWLGKPLIPAIMNLVLLICNASLPGLPRKIAPRIYLASLFIFVVTIQGIYSGQLASLLTKNVRLPMVNSIEDLNRADLVLYGEFRWLKYFFDTKLRGRLIKPNATGKTKELFDRNSARVGPKLLLISSAAKYNFHLSREPMSAIYGYFNIRKDFPLKERVNLVYGRLAASGIPDLLYAREVQREMNIIESFEVQDGEPKLKVLTLEHLGFAFTILAVGLGCATVALIVELATREWD